MNDVVLRDVDAAMDESSDRATEGAFDWRNCWYPVSFLDDLPRDRPTPFSLYDEPMMLFFDRDAGLCCLEDRCAHRGARLSDGNMLDGRIECLYHGWQFGAGGQCHRIPQLEDGKPIPDRACVRAFPLVEKQGLVWIWAGDPERADPALIPTTPVIDEPGMTRVDFQMDLPYDQSYLIENIIDVAHIHIAHDGMRGGGLRAAAKPLLFDVQESSKSGIRSTYKSIGLLQDESKSPLKAAVVEFVAPNLIRYTSEYKNPRFIAGLSLYSIPLGKSRCRLLYRKYANFTSWQERWKPRWLEHWTQCLILEQDMNVVIGQYEAIERKKGPIRDLWQPLKTSDRLVIEYRKWLDRYGHDLPFYRGFVSSKNCGDSPSTPPLPKDRGTLHTRICGTCSRTYRNVERTLNGLWGSVAAFAALGVVTTGSAISSASVVAALLGLIGIAGLREVKKKFE